VDFLEAWIRETAPALEGLETHNCSARRIRNLPGAYTHSHPLDISQIGPVNEKQRMDVTQSSSSRVAVCLTGQMRNSFEPCTVHYLLDRLVKPLNADLYVYLNAQHDEQRMYQGYQKDAFDSAPRLKKLLIDSGVQLRSFHVLPLNDMDPKSDCPDGQGVNSGFPQSLGFRACGEQVVGRGYDWIVRTRTDLSMPARFLSLPKRLPNIDSDSGVVLANPGSDCPCSRGLLQNASTKNVPLCQCTIDTFALVYGYAAHHAYFMGFHDDYVHCRRHQFGCIACAKGGRWTRSPPECKLGASLAARGIQIWPLIVLARTNISFWPELVRGKMTCMHQNIEKPVVDIDAQAMSLVPPQRQCPLATR